MNVTPHNRNLRNRFRLGSTLLLAALFAAMLVPLGARAQSSETKADNSDNLDQASSWLENVTPTGTTLGIWNGTVESFNVVNSVGSGITLGAVQILNPQGSMTITGNSGSLTLAGLAPSSVFTSTTGVAARYVTTFGSNADLVFTANTTGLAGALGNNVTITYVNPGTNNAAAGLSITGNAITVNLATNSTGGVTSTASSILALINANTTATALVTPSLALGSSGAGIVSALSSTGLVGGVDSGTRGFTPVTIDGVFYYANNVGSAPKIGIDMSNATVNLNISAPIVLGSTQEFLSGTATTLTVSGNISDGGNNYGLIIGSTSTSVGTVVLSGNNTFGGNLTINSGTLFIQSNVSAGNGTIVINGGTLRNTSGGAVILNNPVIFNGAGSPNFGFNYNGSNSMVFNSTVSVVSNTTITSNTNITLVNATGPGTITKAGSGNVIFIGTNNFGTSNTSGVVLIINSGNNVRLGNGTTQGVIVNGVSVANSTLTGTISDGGSLVLNQPTDYTLQNLITGAGTLTQASSNILTITNPISQVVNTTTVSMLNTYSGSTTINGGGTLQLGNGTQNGYGSAGLSSFNATTSQLNINGAIVNNGAVVFNEGGLDTLYSGVMSGSGSLRISSGTYSAVNASLTTNLVTANSNLVFTSVNATLAGSLGNNLTVSYVQQVGNSKVLNATITGNAVVVNLGTNATGVANTTAADIVTLLTGNATITATNAGGSNGSGVLSAMAAANLVNGSNSRSSVIFSNTNTFTGTTTIDTGLTLILANTTGTSALGLSGSTLNYINGTGSIAFANNTFTALTLGGLSGNKDLPLTINGTQSIALSVGGNNQSTTYSGILSNGGFVSATILGTVTKSGSGTWTLQNKNTYSGNTTLSGGTIDTNQLNNFGGVTSAGATGFFILNGGQLRWTANYSSGTNNATGLTNLASGDNGDISMRMGGAAVNAITASSTFNTNGNDITLSALAMNGSNVTVTKAGNGTLTLGNNLTLINGANNGSITVANGTLQFGNFTAGAYTGTANTVAYSIAVNNGATLMISEPNATTTLSGVLSGSGNVILNGATSGATAQLTTGFANGTAGSQSGLLYKAATSGTAGNAVSIAYANGGNNQVLSLSVSGSAVTVNLATNATGVVTTTAADLVAFWNNASNTNATAAQSLASLALAPGPTANTGNATLSVLSATNLGNGASANGGLSINYAGTNAANNTIKLTATNTLTGVVTLQGGTLDISASGNVLQNATLNLANGSITYGTQTILRMGGLSGNQNISLTNPSNGRAVNLIIQGTQSPSAYSGQLFGRGSITKTNTGTLSLSGVNVYTGGTLVTGGLINFNSATNFGSGNITLFNGGIQWATGTTTDISGQINGRFGGLQGNISPNTGNDTFDTNGNNVTFASSLSGNGALVKAGNGTLTLTVNNTYSGGTVANGGLINFGNLTEFGTGNITLLGGGLQFGLNTNTDISSRLNSNLTIGNATLTLLTAPNVFNNVVATIAAIGTNNTVYGVNGNNITLQLINPTNGALSLSVNGTNIIVTLAASGGTVSTTNQQLLNLLTNSTAVTSMVTITPGSANMSAAVSATSISGNNAQPLLNGGTNTLDTNGNDITLSALLSGTGGLTKDGIGNLTLSANNTFTGVTTITGGNLVLASNLALQNSTLLYNTGGGNISFFTLSNLTLGGLSGNRDIDLSNALGTVLDLTVGTNNANSTYSGNLTDIHNLHGNLTKVGTGTLTLSGVNTFSGATFINGGTINFNSNGAFGSNGNVTINNAGLTWAAGTNSDVSSVLHSTNGLNSGNITFNTNGNDVTLSAHPLAGSGSLVVRTGTGILTLVGTETYTGGTTLSSTLGS